MSIQLQQIRSGIKVNALRFRNVIIAGAVAGLGGAYFTVGAVGSLVKR